VIVATNATKTKNIRHRLFIQAMPFFVDSLIVVGLFDKGNAAGVGKGRDLVNDGD
jgi:hypothetical protein